MTVTIELMPEIEAGLSALASARGLAVSEYLRQMIEERVPNNAKRVITQGVQAWISIIPSFFRLDVPTSQLRLMSVFKAVSWLPGPLNFMSSPRSTSIEGDLAAAITYLWVQSDEKNSRIGCYEK